MKHWEALNEKGFFSTVSEADDLLHPIPNKKLSVYKEGFTLGKGNQLESLQH